MRDRRHAITWFCCLFVASTLAWGKQPALSKIDLDDPGIDYQGIRYLSVQPDVVRFSRFRPDLLELGKPALGFNPVKARVTTGGTIAFRTDSRTARLIFRSTEGLNRGSEFGIYIDGRFVGSQKFNERQKEIDLRIERESATEPVLWEVTLPSFANPDLLGFEIEKDAKLEPGATPARKVYVALGDSITHGTGQGSATHLTWPYILSRKLDYTLYNLAVGGSGVSVAAGQSLSAFDSVDAITILIGYNDWNGEGDTAEVFKNQYRDLLMAIRESHPETPVFCISPLVTRRETSKSSGLPIDGFRTSVWQLVEEFSATDSNIYFIAGESVSSVANLRLEESGDPVHLSIDGAALLAEAIHGRMIKNLP
jgi:lysophospholipase L1-like esterase